MQNLDKELIEYFNGDELAAKVWKSKYATEGEITPSDMHMRMAVQFAITEYIYVLESRNYIDNKQIETLSDYGQDSLLLNEEELPSGELLNFLVEKYFALFDNFKYIIPQGSIMSTLGTSTIASLSNCWVEESPLDSYASILRTDANLAFYYKRRGGVGIDLSNLRPKGTATNNTAKTTTGVVSFMPRFSNTTREVAMDGRRGALMLSIDINHPDSMDFIKSKRDGTSVTGANISIKLNNEFMKAVENDEDYILRFPCDANIEDLIYPDKTINYDELYKCSSIKKRDIVYTKKIKAKGYWDEIVKSARNYAEPGLMYWDNILDNDPAGVYEQYKPITSNPCFHPDTLIETEKGRLKIKDITSPIRVYSMDSKGKLVMSNATDSFISKKNAKTLKINLRSGASLQVTPNHKLYVRDVGWVEAKDLVVGNMLGHLCRSRRGAKYAGVHLTTSPNGREDQIMEHKLVYGQHNIGDNIHHIDGNTYNNSIDNLELMSHSDHSRFTAINDNPQTHQVSGTDGRFISDPNSKKGKKTVIDLPEELKTNVLNRGYASIISIEEGETTDVYDIQVEKTHCLIANNIVAHNCGEQFLNANDSCRLMALNLYSFVDKPFTDKAKIDYEKLYEVSYEHAKLGDNLIDLELQYIQKILDKIKSDPEPYSIKEAEYNLWETSYKNTKAGRRIGLGITALADMLAAINVQYGSEESLEVIEKVMSTKMEAELDCTIDLAILRGTFEGYNKDLEFSIAKDFDNESVLEGNNNFYDFIASNFPKQVERMYKYGRRNISWSTIAPTGSVSLLTQTTSGCEPLFAPYHIRRKKINPSEVGVKVDFVDEMGDKWQEFPVLHEKFKIWLKVVCEVDYSEINGLSKELLDIHFKNSPWYGATANDIPWEKRNEVQSTLQKHTTNAISSTINLPKTTSEQEVSDIYLDGWKRGLKGQTVYVDGSRSGVLVSNKKSKETAFEYRDAPKRPKVLKADGHTTVVKGKKFNVIIGLMDGKPYETFMIPFVKELTNGELVKTQRGVYTYKEDERGVLIDKITNHMSDEQEAMTRILSMSLRHGADIKFAVEQLRKVDGDMFSFTKGIARVLSKYIVNGVESTLSCDSCGSERVIFEEGCSKCLDCGHSACS